MDSRHERLHRVLRIAALFVWAGLLVYALIHRTDFTLERILSYTPERPLLAAGVLLFFFALKSLTVFFYSGAIYLAAGVLFSAPAAILVNLLGTLVMSLIPYVLARGFTLHRAGELRKKHPKIQKFDNIRDRNPFSFVVVLRCINIVNFDVGSMYCGVVRLPPIPFLFGSLLGKLTDLVMFSVMGKSLQSRDPAPFFIALVIDLAIAFAVTLWAKKQNDKEASMPCAETGISPESPTDPAKD